MQRPWAGLDHRLLGLQGSALVGRVSSPAAPRLCPWTFTPHTLSSLFSWPPRPPFLQASSSGVFHSLHGAFHPNRCSQSPCHMTWTQIIQAGSTYCPRRRVTLSNWAPCTCRTGPCLPRPERGQVSRNTRCTSSCRAGPSLRRGRVCFLARLGRAAAEGPRLLPPAAAAVSLLLPTEGSGLASSSRPEEVAPWGSSLQLPGGSEGQSGDP